MEFIPNHPILEFLPDTLSVLRQKYNLDGGRMAQSIDILEKWIQKQQHFKNKNISRDYLEKSILTCKGSVEKAKSQVDTICTLRTLLPHFFVYDDLEKIFSIARDFLTFVPLPKMTKSYYRVLYLKIGSQEITTELYSSYFKSSLVWMEYFKAHDYFDGCICILNLTEANIMEILMKTNFVEYHQFSTILLKGSGLRLKEIHIVTQSKTVDLLIRAFKKILSLIRNLKIYIHPSIENIRSYIDEEALPIDLGGKEKSTEELKDMWTKLLCSAEHEKQLNVVKTYCTDESLRQTENSNDNYEHMGLSGSFRTLTVD